MVSPMAAAIEPTLCEVTSSVSSPALSSGRGLGFPIISVADSPVEVVASSTSPTLLDSWPSPMQPPALRTPPPASPPRGLSSAPLEDEDEVLVVAVPSGTSTLVDSCSATMLDSSSDDGAAPNVSAAHIRTGAQAVAVEPPAPGRSAPHHVVPAAISPRALSGLLCADAIACASAAPVSLSVSSRGEGVGLTTPLPFAGHGPLMLFRRAPGHGRAFRWPAAAEQSFCPAGSAAGPLCESARFAAPGTRLLAPHASSAASSSCEPLFAPSTVGRVEPVASTVFSARLLRTERGSDPFSVLW